MTVKVSPEEEALLSDVSTELPKAILDRFSTLVRESGSQDEKTAFSFLENYLKQWNIPYQVHYPELYLSIPQKSRLKVVQPVEKEYRVKSPSFSISTGEGWIEDELVYIPTGYAKEMYDVFGTGVDINGF